MQSKSSILLMAVAVTSVVSHVAAAEQRADYVIQISVDGLRPDAITTWGSANLPNFYKFRTEGLFTDNARTDYDYAITLPNHTSQLTGRPVLNRLGPNSGHNWVENGDPPSSTTTLESNAGYYIAGAFDVAHDNGLKTALYATKSKFVLFEQTWNESFGALDVTGEDNGRDKIDTYVNFGFDSPAIMASLLSNLGPLGSAATRSNYTFLHLHDTDTAGHSSGWDVTSVDTPYMQSVRTVDGYLGEIFTMIANTPELTGKTAVLLTADHGGGLASGMEPNHGDVTSVFDYTIPFYTWGPGIAPGDLYTVNSSTRANPGADRTTFDDALQPIRNGDIGNLSLDMLGLNSIPGSFLNASQNLLVPEPTGGTMMVVSLAAILVISRKLHPSFAKQKPQV
jgi:hypothetical protein